MTGLLRRPPPGPEPESRRAHSGGAVLQRGAPGRRPLAHARPAPRPLSKHRAGPRLAGPEGRPAIPALSRGTDGSGLRSPHRRLPGVRRLGGRADRIAPPPAPGSPQRRDVPGDARRRGCRRDRHLRKRRHRGRQCGPPGGGRQPGACRGEPAARGGRGGLAAPHANRVRLGRVPPGPGGGSPRAGHLGPGSPRQPSRGDHGAHPRAAGDPRQGRRRHPGSRPDPARRGR